MTNEHVIRVVRRGFKNAGWESPADDLVRQVAAEIEKELIQEKAQREANESVI